MLSGALTTLRAIEREDLAALLAWRNEPDLRRYFREYRELSLANQERWYEQHVVTDPRTSMFAITESATQRLLGAAGLCYIDWVNRTADMSIYLGAERLYVDDAFAPDAARTLLRYGFDTLGLHRVWVEIYDYDDRKRSLLESLGFVLEGRHREHHYEDGRRHDSLFFGLLRPEFAS